MTVSTRGMEVNMNRMVFTLVGQDQPGLLDSLAKQVYSLDGNWLSSNFSHMAGHFAGFVSVQIPNHNQEKLMQAFSNHPHLHIHLLPGKDDSLWGSQAQIEITGNDKPGIVQELSHVLNQFNINILTFESALQSAPNWGSSLFVAKAQIAMPQGFDIDELRRALEQIANDLVVDIELS